MRDARKRDLNLLRRGIELNNKFKEEKINSDTYVGEVKKIMLAYSYLVEDLINEIEEK